MNKQKVFKGVGIAAGIAVCVGIGWFFGGLFGGMASGMPGMPGMGETPPAAVNAVEVRRQYLHPAEEYIARVEPIEDVMIRSEVAGYIENVHFTEGGMVNEGDVLFTIDQRTYQAAVDAAKADVLRAERLYDRMKNADARSVSKSDLETAESELMRAQAALDQAQVNLDYTEIKAPVSGRIGAAQVTKGNYVSSASGALARIVQMDPIRVTFSLTDREYLTFRQNELSGASETRVAQVRLPDETVLPEIGKKDFDDNAVNPQTGTIAVRYLFENPDGLLLPGGFVTALLRTPEAEKGILIPQKAVLVDQQGSYVLTVDENGNVGTARIERGPQIETGVVVRSGLQPGDRIIVDGVQKAQPGATVNVTLLEDK